MKKWKFIPLLLIVGILCLSLTGCSGTKKGTEETKKDNSSQNASNNTADTENKGDTIEFPLGETITMSMFAFSSPGAELDKTLAMKQMEEMTNVKWDISVASGVDIAEKRSLEFTGGEYKDVYFKAQFDEATVAKYASEGIIIPLNDLIERYAPNLKALLDERDAWKYITSDDGNIYALPQIIDPEFAVPSLFINQAWLDKLGLDMPATPEDFYNVLKAFKEGDPNGNGKADEIPMFMPSGMADYLLPYYGIPFDGSTMSTYNEAEGTIKYFPTSSEYKEFLRTLTSFYNEGLVNNYFTATWEEQNAFGATEDVMGVFFSYGAYLTVGTEKDEQWPMLMPFYEKSFPSNNGIGYGAFAITDKCENPEIAMKWVDYFYSEEGAKLAWMGVEGESYTLNNDGTYTWNTDGTYGTDIASVRAAATIYGDVNAPCVRPTIFNQGQTNAEELFLLKEREKLKAFYADPYPTLIWTDTEMQEKSMFVSSINPYFLQYEAEVVTGKKDIDASWDEYIATMKSMGVEEMNKIDQAAYERYLAKGNK